MFGPIDIDSRDFQTRLRIAQIADLTGETRDQVIARALEECYQREIAAATDEQLAARDRRASERLFTTR